MLWSFIAAVDMMASSLALVVPWVKEEIFTDKTKTAIVSSNLHDIFELEDLGTNSMLKLKVDKAEAYSDQWASIFSMAVLVAFTGVLGYGAVLSTENSAADRKYFKYVGILNYPLQTIFLIVAIALHYVVAGNVVEGEIEGVYYTFDNNGNAVSNDGFLVMDEHYAGPVLYFILLAHSIALSVYCLKEFMDKTRA